MSTATMQSVKWSLTGETARAIWSLKTKGSVFCMQSRDMAKILKYAPEFRRAENFAAFLDVNGIEIID